MPKISTNIIGQEWLFSGCLAQQFLLLQQSLEGDQPAFVVTAAGIKSTLSFSLSDGLDELLLELAPGENTSLGQANGDSERLPLPVGVEYHLATFTRQCGPAVHLSNFWASTALPSHGAVTFATPIIASRSTSSASSLSVRCSVFSGRSGKTR